MGDTLGATSPKLPAQTPDYLFLACFGDNVQAAAAAEYAYQDLKARTKSFLVATRSLTICVQTSDVIWGPEAGAWTPREAEVRPV